jgi:hypothetical protein
LYLFFAPSRQEGDNELRVGLWRLDFLAVWFLSHLAPVLLMVGFNRIYRARADDSLRIKSPDYPTRLHQMAAINEMVSLQTRP